MNRTRKLTLTAMMMAIGTLTSHMLFIPLGIVKAFPVQHFLNVLSAVLLGPYYAIVQALGVSLLRNMMGTGSLFAFPGSMLGAFFAAWLYRKTKKIGFAVAGEVIGTGFIGALASYPLAVFLLGKDAAVFGFVPAFFVSSLAGSAIGFVILQVFMKNAAGRVEINQ